MNNLIDKLFQGLFFVIFGAIVVTGLMITLPKYRQAAGLEQENVIHNGFPFRFKIKILIIISAMRAFFNRNIRQTKGFHGILSLSIFVKGCFP